jgi:organic anion transporter 6A
MAQDKIKQKDAVKQAQVVDMDEHQKTKEPRKLEMFLVTLPTAVKKFADTPDMKKSDRKYKDPSEEPYGLGSLVFPCLQRFNNVKSFLTLSFLAVVAHSKLEEQGCSGERMYCSRHEAVTLWEGACG